MKKLGWTIMGAALGVVLTASLLTKASAQGGTMTLYGEAPKGAKTGSQWTFKFSDPKTGATVVERKGSITVQNGRYMTDVESKELDPNKVYSLSVAGEAGEELAPVTFVTLQGTTPGVAESGNINVTGTIIAGKIQTGNGGSWPYLINGHTTTTTGGVFGASAANGVRGVTTDVAGGYAGGSFKASNGSSYGLYSLNTSTTGDAFGGYFKTASSTGTAIYGSADSFDLIGARFGVQGYARAGIITEGAAGVRGTVQSDFIGASLNSGVHGVQQGIVGPMIYGLFATGNSGATGVKTFLIDMPSDPENKMLRHYSAEGPEPLLIYSGTATLDASGTATVNLPAYWSTINKDPRYQLTAIGGAMPNLHIAMEVKNNQFRIGGGTPKLKVTWTVTGTRNDPFVRQIGIQDVVEKPASMRGKYFHPSLYGQPEGKAYTAPVENAAVNN